MSLAGKALAAIGLHAASSAVHAQAYQCSVPQRIAVPRILPDGPPRTTSIAGYSLTLSWSPEYCRMRTHDPRDAMQCSGRNGRFGLVLHGLWPEGKGADWPQWCPTALAPSADALRPMLCTTPSPDLLAHEWAKHGSCMAKTPEGYFRAGRALFRSLRIPDLDALSRRQGLNAGMIRQVLADANPALTTAMIGIGLNPRGWLEEVRICYGRDFMPRRCAAGRLGAPNSAPAKIWRGL